MNAFSQEGTMLIQSLGWTLLHSIWQGAIIFCSMKLLQLAAGQSSAKARYYITLASLSALIAWTIDTFIRQWERIQVITVITGQTGNSTTGLNTVHTTTLPVTIHSDHFINRILPGIEQYFPYIATAYFLGMLIMLVRLGIGINKIYQLRNRHTIAAPAAWKSSLDKWVKDIGINKRVQVYLSQKINVPMVVGTLKPIILFPVAAANNLSIQQFEAILLHELAHIRRNDYLLNIIQTVAETLMFFNPFVWLISANIRREREHCCDDLVLSYTSQPIVYARALATIEANRFFNDNLALKATGNNKQQLLNRIKRIVEMKKQPLNMKHLLMSLIVIACIITTLGWLAPTFAQTRDKDQKEKKERKEEKNTPAQAKDKEEKKAVKEEIIIEGPVTRAEAAQEAKAVEKAMQEVDWDKINAEIAKAKAETEKALAEIDWDKIEAEMEKAKAEGKKKMSEAEWEKVKEDMARAKAEMAREIAKIDWDKIEADMAKAKAEHQKAMEEVNWEEIDATVNTAMKTAGKALESIDWDAIGSSISEAMNNVDWEEIQTDDAGKQKHKRKMTISANATGSTANVVVTNPGYGSGKNNEHATANTSRSRVSSTEYEQMIVKMEKEGLLDIAEGYKIRKDGNELYIDGNKQPVAVYNRYKKYLDGERINISGNRKSLVINVND